MEEREHFDGRVYLLKWTKGDLVASRDPCGRVTKYRYDMAGRIVSRKTPEGETTWRYEGRDVAEIANENGVLGYERDETGQIAVERQLGTEIRYERDGMGRRTRQTTPWGETRYAYDANGDWIGLAHGDAQIAVERDAMGREVRRHVGTVSGGKLGTFDQAFDPVGRLTGQRYRPGGGEEVAWWRHVQYDGVGNPTRISDSARGTKDYLHNAAGQLIGVLHDGKQGEFYEWDSRGNIFYEAEVQDARGSLRPWRGRWTGCFPSCRRCRESRPSGHSARGAGSAGQDHHVHARRGGVRRREAGAVERRAGRDDDVWVEHARADGVGEGARWGRVAICVRCRWQACRKAFAFRRGQIQN